MPTLFLGLVLAACACEGKKKERTEKPAAPRPADAAAETKEEGISFVRQSSRSIYESLGDALEAFGGSVPVARADRACPPVIAQADLLLRHETDRRVIERAREAHRLCYPARARWVLHRIEEAKPGEPGPVAGETVRQTYCDSVKNDIRRVEEVDRDLAVKMRARAAKLCDGADDETLKKR